MSLVTNIEKLGIENSELRKNALEILEVGLEAINTEKILRERISMHDGAFCLEGMGFQCQFYERIFFIGIGKCAFDGARVIEDILGDALTDGIVVDVKAGSLRKIKSYTGTHPNPSPNNIAITKQILEMVKGVTSRDLVLVLVSGGGSALLSLPYEISCEALVHVSTELTERGADIYEMNTVRKHLSLVHGGGLAKHLYPAQVVSLIFSDVLGNDISVVASGPTVRDETTKEDAQDVLDKYKVGADLKLVETPKDPELFSKVRNFLIVSNADALVAMKQKAEELGYNASIESEILSGEASEVGEELAKQEMKDHTCLLYGGETTVKIAHNNGKGGRNQELALSALPHLPEGRVLVAATSDGWDNTDAAGAIADRAMYEHAIMLNLEPKKFLENNDSYNFWKDSGGAIYTGRLESNVSDLIIILNRNGK